MMTELTIELLGGFHISRANDQLVGFRQPRIQKLVAFLLLHRQQPQSRRHIAFTFWPDSSEKQALANLRKLLYLLVRALPELPQYLEITPTSLQWQADAPAEVDVFAFESLLTNGLADANNIIVSQLEQATELYRHDLLPQMYDDWLETPRQRLRAQYLEAVTKIIEWYESQRQFQQAIEWAWRLQQRDPLQEAIYRTIMRLNLLMDDRAAALRTFHQCATLLAEELGVDPGTATRKLHIQALQLEESDSLPTTNNEASKFPLAGRINEWNQLQKGWRQAQKGRAGLLLVGGVAGIGKTRLVEELVDSTRKVGQIAIHTRAYAATGSGAFAPVVTLLRASEIYDALQSLDDVWLVELSRLLPELKATRPDLPEPASMEEQWQQHRFHEAISRCLLHTRRPLLIHFDDLQWCDAGSIAWLQFLLEYDRAAPLLVVGTVRSDEIEAIHPINQLHQQLRRHNRSSKIDLQPLVLEEIAQLVSFVVGHYSEPSIPGSIFAETEGHPLFALEILRSGRYSAHPESSKTGQPVANGSRKLPPQIDAAIQWRLGQLSAGARQLAAVAAVIGRNFTHELLSKAVEQSDYELVQSLDELWRRRIIKEEGDSAYDFGHDFIRDVAYGMASPIQRRHYHNRVAEALRAEVDINQEESNAQIARHYFQAGHLKKARVFFERAGDFAAAQFADAEAISLYARALTCWDMNDHVSRFKLHAKREAIFAKTVQVEEWQEELSEMARLAQDQLLSDPTAVQATIETAIRRCRYERLVDQKVPLQPLEAALGLAKQHDLVELETRALIALGNQHNPLRFDLSAKYLREAIVIAERNNLIPEAADAYEKLAPALLMRGEPETVVENCLRTALDYAEKTGRIRQQAMCHEKLGYLLMYQGEGRLEEATDSISKGLQLAQEIGASQHVVIFAANLGRAYTFAGNYAKVLHYLELAESTSRLHQFNYYRAHSIGFLGYLYLNMGDYEQTRRCYMSAFDEMRKANWAISSRIHGSDLGYLEFVTGRFEEASRQYARALDAAVELGDKRMHGWIRTRQGRLLTATGQFERAEAAFREAITIHQALGQSNRTIMAVAGLAELNLKRGELPAAYQHVEAILTHLAKIQLDMTDESLAVYMIANHVLQAAGDPRAAQMAQLAQSQLQTRAATIEDKTQLKIFWDAPLHAEAMDLAT